MRKIEILIDENNWLDELHIDGSKVFDNKEVPQGQGTSLEIHLSNFGYFEDAINISTKLL